MSVKYRAVYGYGFHIKPEQVKDMSEEKYEQFVENDFTYILNSWKDNEEYFFGIEVKSAEPGEIVNIPVQQSHDRFIEMINTFKYFFPETSPFPRHYIFNQVY